MNSATPFLSKGCNDTAHRLAISIGFLDKSHGNTTWRKVLPPNEKRPPPEKPKGLSSHQVGTTRRLLNFSSLDCGVGKLDCGGGWMTVNQSPIDGYDLPLHSRPCITADRQARAHTAGPLSGHSLDFDCPAESQQLTILSRGLGPSRCAPADPIRPPNATGRAPATPSCLSPSGS